MSETITPANWTEHLLKLDSDWASDPSKIPVIKVTTFSSDGEKLGDGLAIVGPVRISGLDIKTPGVMLFNEEIPKGRRSIYANVEVETLERRCWVDPDGAIHIINFVGFAGDKDLIHINWSYINFPPK